MRQPEPDEPFDALDAAVIALARLLDALAAEEAVLAALVAAP